MHSALKLEKSAISKVQKSIIFAFLKMAKKSIFAPEKSLNYQKCNFRLKKNNYFLCPNLEKGVALFVGSVKSTFPLHFGSETSKT